MEELLKEISSMFRKYRESEKVSRVDGCSNHHLYCKKGTHAQCLINWGHSSRMIECISRLMWCFLGKEAIIYEACTKLKNRPSLEAATYFILTNREDLTSQEYSWLMKIKDRLKEFKKEFDKTANYPTGEEIRERMAAKGTLMNMEDKKLSKRPKS